MDDKKFQRMLETCRTKQIGTYNTETARIFQELVRAEAALEDTPALAWFDGEIHSVDRKVGECACVTCGRVYPWVGTNKLDTGHFVSGRSITILFEPTNAHPQCAYCNCDGGKVDRYEMFMRYVYGHDEIARLRELPYDKNHWWLHASRYERQDWAVRKRMEFRERLNKAKKALG